MVLRKPLRIIYLIPILLITFGCSPRSMDDQAVMDNESASIEQDFSRQAIGEEEMVEMDMGEESAQTNEWDSADLEQANRKIIYNAYLDLEDKQYLEVIDTIEQKTLDMNGYIVSNQTSRLDDQLHHGHMVLRIPQESLTAFFDFLDAEDQITINQRAVTGEDVTEQYVDLETRLNSREQLEDRLMTFMEEAETTEDLINISRDLADVQYEIEQIKGQINYLDNRSDLATVELSIIELQTELAHDQNLDIWDRINEKW